MKEPERVWLPNGAATLLPVNLRVERGMGVVPGTKTSREAALPPWERTYNAAPAADGRRREEETHTLKWTRDWSRRRGGEPPRGGGDKRPQSVYVGQPSAERRGRLAPS